MASSDTPFISLVIPVYNELANIRHFYPLMRNYLDGQSWRYEIIYVSDGSTDGSDDEIRTLVDGDSHVRLIDFSRNFGKEAATSAGIHAAKGDAVIMMDADGQFPIELMEQFVQSWEEGAEVVVGVRQSNQREGMVKRYGSKLFYRILNTLTGGRSVPGATDFRLIDRKVADVFNELTERTRITRGLIDWLGYRRAYVYFDAHARIQGAATYTFGKLVKLALHTFVSQSTRPLLFTGLLGAFVTAVSLVAGVFVVVERYVLGDPLQLAFTGTAVLAIFLSFLIGVVLMCQGLLALYIESIHNETQNRPLYVVREERTKR